MYSSWLGPVASDQSVGARPLPQSTKKNNHGILRRSIVPHQPDEVVPPRERARWGHRFLSIGDQAGGGEDVRRLAAERAGDVSARLDVRSGATSEQPREGGGLELGSMSETRLLATLVEVIASLRYLLCEPSRKSLIMVHGRNVSGIHSRAEERLPHLPEVGTLTGARCASSPHDQLCAPS